MSVRVKVAAQTKAKNTPGWPCINFDYDKELDRIMKPVREKNPDIEFDVCKYTCLSQAEADYEQDAKTYDGILVLMMTNWLNIDQFYCKQSRDGVPVIVADVPYCGSGSTLSQSSSLIRDEQLPVPLISSTNYGDIADAVKNFAVLKRMKESTILVVKNRGDMERQEAAKEIWGCSFVNATAGELMKYFDQIPDEMALKTANIWKQEALGILEPSEDDILESARLYHAIMAMKEVVHADAVTIDCLELGYNDTYGVNRHMYPCLSYYQMNNDGQIGVCEADINSTIASMLTLYLTGRPGYVSDPVVDTASDEIIYAHCVACRKVYGCDDARICQHYIRSHAEDKKGASVQVIFPTGEPLTTVNIDVLGRWASIHSSVSVGNAFGDAGCRSKLVAKTDAGKLLKNWLPQWHRVTVFGEYRQMFVNLFTMKGLAIYEEDK